MSTEQPNRIEQVNPAPSEGTKPAAGAVLPQPLILGLTVLVGVAAIVVAIPGLPPVVHTIAISVIAVGAALGVASPGIRRPPRE